MNATTKLLESVVPSSVTVRAEIPAAHASAQILGTERTGSGTLIDSTGVVLTVNYVVMGAASVEVTLADDTMLDAEIVAQDFHSGIAALRIPGGGYPALPHRGRRPAVGDEVFIIASAGGASRRVNSGAVISLAPFDAFWEYHLERGILTTAMNPGFGGGALVAHTGDLVGVVSLDFNEVGRFTLAIPAEYFFDHYDELLRDKRRTTRPQRAWLGLYCYDMHEHVVIAGVLPGGPSEQAGLRPGDVVLSVDGKKVSERRTFYAQLWTRKPGEVLHIEVFREKGAHDVAVHAGDAEQFFA
jgi:S1-C subfamily serine protease